MEGEHKVQDTQSSEDQNAVVENSAEQQDLSSEDRLKAEAKNYRLRAKKYRSEVEDLRRELDGIKSASNEAKITQLASQGNWKEIAESKTKELDMARQEIKRKEYEIKHKSARDAFFKIAENKGCVGADLLYNELESKIELNDNYEIEIDLVDHLLEREKLNRPYLFKHSVPDFKTGTTAKAVPRRDSKNPKDESREEKLSFLKDLGEDVLNNLL